MKNRMRRPGLILGGIFNEIWIQKGIQIVSKFGCKATLVGDVMLERYWNESGANGQELPPPRGRFWEGVEGTFLGRRTNTHAWFTP